MRKTLSSILAVVFVLTIISGVFVLPSGAAETWQWPIKNQIFSRGYYGGHDAVDIAAPTGTAVNATKSGWVECASTASASSTTCGNCGYWGAGYHVIVNHGSGYRSIYAHLSRVNVSYGQSVSGGQKIGEVGSTGESTGPHLHFAVEKGGFDKFTNPLLLITPFQNVYADGISNTNATIRGIFGAFGPTIERAGFYWGKSASNMTKVTEDISSNGYLSSGEAVQSIYYNLANWGITLTPGVTYYYKLYIVRDGGIEYCSDVYSFTTTGSHNHTYDSGTVTTEASCKKEGVKTFTCTICGNKKTSPIEKKAHTYGTWTKNTSENHKKVCTVCNDTVTASHTWNAGQITKDPSCKQEGEKTYTCTVCGETKKTVLSLESHSYGAWEKDSASTHKKVCSVCGDAVKASHTWDSGKITKEATCKTEGERTYTCTTCGETQKIAISKLTVHTYGPWVDIDENNFQRTCSVCGDAQTSNHKWDNGTVEKEATCKEDGQIVFRCQDCNQTKTQTIEKHTDHTYGTFELKDASAHKKVCSVCSKEESFHHLFDQGVLTKPATPDSAGTKTYTCMDCNYKKTENVPYDGKEYDNLLGNGATDNPTTLNPEEDGSNHDTADEDLDTSAPPAQTSSGFFGNSTAIVITACILCAAFSLAVIAAAVIVVIIIVKKQKASK